MSALKRSVSNIQKKADRLLLLFLSIILPIRAYCATYGGILGHIFSGDSWCYLSNALNFAGYPTPYEVIRAPLYPFIVSILIRIGADLWAALLVNIIADLTLIISTYLLVSELYNKEIALISTVLVSSNWHLWWYSQYILIEIPVLALTFMTFYFFLTGLKRGDHRRIWIAGVLWGLSFLMKYTSLLIGAVFLFYLLVTRRLSWIKERNIWIGIAATSAVFGVWSLYNWVRWNNPIHSIIYQLQYFPHRSWYGMGEQRDYPSPFYLGKIGPILIDASYLAYTPYSISLPVTILSAIEVFSIFKKKRLNKSNMFVLFWFATWFFSFSCLMSLKDVRYLVFMTPPLLVLAAKRLIAVKDKNKKIFVFLLLLAIISTNNDRPVPFIDFQNRMPYLVLSESFPYLQYRPLRPVIQRILEEASTSYIEPEIVDLCKYIRERSSNSDAILVIPPESQPIISTLTRRRVLRWEEGHIDSSVKFVILWKKTDISEYQQIRDQMELVKRGTSYVLYENPQSTA